SDSPTASLARAGALAPFRWLACCAPSRLPAAGFAPRTSCTRHSLALGPIAPIAGLARCAHSRRSAAGFAPRTPCDAFSLAALHGPVYPRARRPVHLIDSESFTAIVRHFSVRPSAHVSNTKSYAHT